ncbi:hypothetical protein T484DRAFT_1916514, partial [Baffinella frigidus]
MHGGWEGGHGGGGVHPKLLTASLQECWDLEPLCALVANHSGEFNTIHIQVAIRKLSMLIEPSRTWTEGTPGTLDEDHWAPLFDRASVLADRFCAEDVALLTHAVSTIEGGAAALFMEKLHARALQLMPKMQLRQLLSLAHAPAEGIPHRLLEATVWRVENLLPKNAGKKTLHWGLQVLWGHLWSNWGVELRGQLARMPASELADWIHQSESAAALRVVLFRIEQFNERHVGQAMGKLAELARGSCAREIAEVGEMAQGVAEWGCARYGKSDSNVDQFLRKMRKGGRGDDSDGRVSKRRKNGEGAPGGAIALTEGKVRVGKALAASAGNPGKAPVAASASNPPPAAPARVGGGAAVDQARGGRTNVAAGRTAAISPPIDLRNPNPQLPAPASARGGASADQARGGGANVAAVGSGAGQDAEARGGEAGREAEAVEA